MEGVYGTLSINTNTGEWTYDPNENIKAANGRASDKFQLNTSDGVTNVTSSFKVDVAVGIKGNGTSDNDYILVDDVNLNLDGGDGIDAVLYQNTSDEYSLKVENNVVTNGGDKDTFTNIERIQFLDSNLAVDLDGMRVMPHGSLAYFWARSQYQTKILLE